jgi:hypothetical protein
MLPLLGFLGFAVLGVLLGFAAVMADLEEHGAHTRHVITHGSLGRAEHAGNSQDMRALMRTLAAVKIVSVALVVLGVGGFTIQQSLGG